MAKYLPHQIYTTISEFSEDLANPIRSFLLGHLQKGSSVDVIASRIDIITKNGNELLVPLPSPMKHLLDNKYNEEVVLTFAKQLGDTIKTFSDDATSDSEQALFLQLRNKLKNISSLSERQEIFFSVCKKRVITSVALQNSIGKMVALGIPQKGFHDDSVDTYGSFLFSLLDSGLSTSTRLNVILHQFYPVDSLGYLIGSVLQRWLSVLPPSKASDGYDSIQHQEQTHLANILGIPVPDAFNNNFPYDSGITHLITNAMRVKQGGDIVYNFCKTTPLQVLFLTPKKVRTMTLCSSTNPMFGNFNKLKDIIVRTLRLAVIQLLGKFDKYSPKAYSKHCHSILEPIKELLNEVHLKHYRYVRSLKDANFIGRLDTSVCFDKNFLQLDYHLHGTDTLGQVHTFKASDIGFHCLKETYALLHIFGGVKDSILHTPIQTDMEAKKEICPVGYSPDDISFTTNNKYTNPELGALFYKEQYQLSRSKPYYETGVNGSLVSCIADFNTYLRILLEAQGVQDLKKAIASNFDYNLHVTTEVMNTSPVKIAGSPYAVPSDEHISQMAEALSSQGHPQPYKIPVAKKAKPITQAFENLSTVAVDLASGTSDFTPDKGITGLSVQLAYFSELYSMAKGESFDTTTPKVMDVVYSGVNGGYLVCLVQGSAYLAARYSKTLNRLSLRWYGLAQLSQTTLEAANNGFVNKSAYHSLHIHITDVRTAKEVLNTLIQRFYNVSAPKKSVLFI